MPNVVVKRFTTLNPASLMPLPDDGDEHDCVAELLIVCTPRPDLKDIPLTNPDLVLYVDGSASRIWVRMVSAINTHWYTRGLTVVAQKHCEACLICITQNSGKPVKVQGTGAHPLPGGPFEHIMLDFIELSPSEGKKHCLVVVDMWSKWVEAFPVKAQTAGAVAKILLREIIPRWGLPKKVSSDNGSHFANEAIAQIGEYLGMDIRKHCSYHPQSGGAVERENGTIKNKLAKCCADTKMSWTQALPIVLMYMRMRKRTRSQLGPFEILFGAPPQIGLTAPGMPLPSTTLCEDAMLSYCINLSSNLADIRRQVVAALPTPADGPLHNLQPGDTVLIKDFRRKSWKTSRWQGPYLILLVTQTAIKVVERATWVHASHCKAVTTHQEENKETDDDK
ncbi:protein NYNRIN-like isoform X1 [Cottoperca gobio]|uniref:Protein NYNRIN-like isoform X1 n=1 Tax=Cottoperca gobio TaxID=56716 RepID=A0A6J2PL17_COTGO|nr:protein NYNRIN-like isoform X1 [Cottoperca gobio]